MNNQNRNGKILAILIMIFVFASLRLIGNGLFPVECYVDIL